MKEIGWQWIVLMLGILCVYIGLAVVINNRGGSKQDLGQYIYISIGSILIMIGMHEKEKKE